MFKNLSTVLLIAVIFISCGGQKGMKLEKGTPIYDLAKELSKKYPVVDPDANKTLIECKYFSITPGSFFTEMQLAMGKKIQDLKQYDQNRLSEALRTNIERLGERKLYYEAAKDAKVVIPVKIIDSTMNVIFQRNGGQENFIKRISGDGIALEVVRQDVEREMTIRRFFEKLEKEMTVSEDELKKAYSEDRTASVRHILLLTQGMNDSMKTVTRKKMEGILARAKNGEDFATLAKEYTEDQYSKPNGGLYENFPKGQMVKSFEDAAFSVPVGSISDLVETQYGYHILQVVDRKKETKPFEQIKNELQIQLLQIKQKSLRPNTLEMLKKETHYQSHL